MHINDLPTDILRMVLERTCRKISVKVNVPLIAVCQRWRRIALPLVRSHLYIELEPPASGRGEVRDPGGGPKDLEVKTNMQFIVSAGCARTVRKVKIGVRCRKSHLRGPDTAAQMMRAAAERWGGVRELCIMLPTKVSNAPGQSEASAAEHGGDVARICTALAAMMPGIHRLSFHGGDRIPVALEIYRQLTVHYAGQLRSIFMPHTNTLPPGMTLTELRRATISCDTMVGPQTRSINPAKLVILELLQCPLNHLWTPFGADGSARTVVFPNLKRLTVVYLDRGAEAGNAVQEQEQEEEEEEDGPWKLHFPSLKSMELVCRHDTCPLIESAVLPPHMEEISITASTRVLQRIANRPLPAAKRLEIVISLDADDYLDTLGAANRIFEGTRAVSKLSLAIVYSPLPVTLEFIYRGLARLELCTDVSVDMMLGIIRGLPSLVELEVSMLSFGHASEDISVPEPGADCTVGLLDAQLERLEIEAARDKLGQDMLPDLIKYMMLAVPGLKFIRSHRVPRRPIAEFVDAYSKWHPHLAEIKLALSTFDSVAKPEPASIANLQSLLLGGANAQQGLAFPLLR